MYASIDISIDRQNNGPQQLISIVEIWLSSRNLAKSARRVNQRQNDSNQR